MTANKTPLKRRILTNDSLSDEHAYIAGMLLTLANGDQRTSGVIDLGRAGVV
jgi:hypothetical protein